MRSFRFFVLVLCMSLLSSSLFANTQEKKNPQNYINIKLEKNMIILLGGVSSVVVLSLVIPHLTAGPLLLGAKVMGIGALSGAFTGYLAGDSLDSTTAGLIAGLSMSLPLVPVSYAVLSSQTAKSSL